MKQIIQIRCKNNKKTLNVEIGSTLSDVFAKLNIEMPYGPISAKVNNKVEGMNFRLYHNKDIEFLDMYSSSGSRAYTRSLFFVLCKAVHDLYPKAVLRIEHPIADGYYCNITNLGDKMINEEMITSIKVRMQEIIARDYPIIKHEEKKEKVIHGIRSILVQKTGERIQNMEKPKKT